ncbi:MAG: hypothetical protein WC683_06990 [bacterium]
MGDVPEKKDGMDGAKADGGGDKPARPEYIPEKFWTGNIEDSAKKMAESYANLEKKQSAPPPKPGAMDLTAPPESLDDNATLSDTIIRAGLTPEVVGKTFVEKGELTKEQYDALKLKGLGKALVNQLLSTEVALQQRVTQDTMAKAYAAAGGEEQWKNTFLWAQANLSEADRKAFTEDLANPARNAHAVKLLLQMHRESVGAGGSNPLNAGRPASGNGNAPFSTYAEYDAAAKAAESDPSKRTAFQQRLKNTPDHIMGALPFLST